MTFYPMKIVRTSLLTKIVVAIILGASFGFFLPDSIVRIFATFNSVFGNFIQFLVPLIILGLVTPAIADIGKDAGKLLVVTVLIAYLDTVFAGCFSYAVGSTFFRDVISPSSSVNAIDMADDLKPYFTIGIPPVMDVMTALVSAFVLGLGIAFFSSVTLKNVFNEFKDIVSKTIDVAIIPLLPVYIFGIFLTMSSSGRVIPILKVFIAIIGIIFVMHVVLLVFQYCLAGAIVKKNPFKLLANMMPAYFTALGTSSSAATIPVALSCTLKNKVTPEIAGFTVPLCATIHLSGSTLKITACALALMMLEGMPFDFGLFLGFILMLGVMMVAAPGVPGGAIMAALGILASMLGFTEQQQALMIALYITMDSFGTACNVTGDGAIALVVDKIFRKNQ